MKGAIWRYTEEPAGVRTLMRFCTISYYRQEDDWISGEREDPRECEGTGELHASLQEDVKQPAQSGSAGFRRRAVSGWPGKTVAHGPTLR